MDTESVAPRIVHRDVWQRELMSLRKAEKALTRQVDALSAQRRRLPMVEVTKAYRLEGTGGPVSLEDLFEGRSQLIVYHFMFGDG